MRACSEFNSVAPALLVLLFALTTSAHEDEAHMGTDMDMDMATTGAGVPLGITPSNATHSVPPSYFRHPEYPNLILAHIALMTIAWVFVLPIAVMLSISRSRLNLLAQSGFLIINSGGVVLAMIYNGKTPDLYPHNAHHTIGWLLTWATVAQLCLALITASARLRGERKNSEEHLPFIQTSPQSAGRHPWTTNAENAPGYRFSDDSGHGTEQNDESSRSPSSSSLDDGREVMNSISLKYYEGEADELALSSKRGQNAVIKRLRGVLSGKAPLNVSSRVTGVLRILETIITRTILIQGFVGITTGAVTYAGIFGRVLWACSFHQRWSVLLAWNIKPRTSASNFSAEFVESFLIFFYGSTNIFLEHLNAWGEAWSAQDMEHISITIMFIGGGLCGMLIESTAIRNLLNINTSKASSSGGAHIPATDGEDEESSWQPPQSYKVSMNPIPALMVLLLGIMMSSHHQSSMVSTMIHKQWGTLLMGASFARGLTYIIFYLSPPTSFLPSRPPSELITAFCLMAGGLVFMASSRDTVVSMEYNNLDAMFVFTVTMGLINNETPDVLDIAIIGAGPCGLAVAARMRETTPSALFTDAEHQRYHWIKRHKHRAKTVPTKGRATKKILIEDKSGKLCGPVCNPPRYLMAVYDSSGSDWMMKWTRLFNAYNIKTLRSPLFFHVDPRDRDGLKAYAYAKGRENEMVELKGVVGKEISKHLMKKKMKRGPAVNAHTGKSIDERDMQDYFTPSTSLFNDYCQDCITRYNLNNLITQADVQSIKYDEQGTDERPDNCFTIKTSTGTQLARTVVLAIGPGVPAHPLFTSKEAEGACHTSQLLKQDCVAPHVKSKVDSKRTTNVIVVGGGLTSAQIVDLCIKKGVSKVWHIMRDNFKVKHFDLSLDWVAKYKNINQAAFWSADSDEERFEMIMSARSGGSITPAYKAVLESHQTKGKVLRHTKTQIVEKTWDPASKLWTIRTEPPIPGLPLIDYIYYATGAKADIKSMPLFDSLLQSHPIDTVGGLPCLTYDMQWSKDVPLFVAGRLAGLQLGPGAANLEGARVGAERIAWRMQEILGDTDRGSDCDDLADEMDELRDRAERSWTHLNMFDTLSAGEGN
ncbi:hypothetical protein V495_08345 [Pseudogymnoascus sp. VKM F-4514 (FW-929)]|nr:hypothetical protein V495_08345 [Pseudogymnoascus sp. VKM F-4514 (FW-929)]KFY62962.1 hypothetical protein V497_02148 [Pseudogymnoascus sp. VKM F-4516 (FW-969)]